MILPSYVFLLLWLAHSPHSLAHYTLHRRMEGAFPAIVAAGHNGQATAELTRTSTAAAHALATDTKSLASPGSSSQLMPALLENHRPLPQLSSHTELTPHELSGEAAGTSHPPDLDLSPPKKPRETLSIARFFTNRWKGFSSSFRRLAFWRTFTPRTFSHTLKLEADFKNLAGLDEKALRKIGDDFIDHTLDEPATWKSVMQLDPRYGDMQKTKEQIYEQLSGIQTFLAKDFGREGEIKQRSEDITHNLKDILASPAYLNAKEPISILGTQLAQTNARALQDSRLAIRKLLDRPLAPLADLHGFLGPENVFSSQLVLLLKDASFARAFPDVQPEQFVKQLEGLQTHLTALDKHASLASEARGPPEALADQIAALQKFQDNQVEHLGAPTEFKALISRIKTSEPYRAFQLELKSPQDTAGFELALVQPLGIARDHGIDDQRVSQLHKFKVVKHRPISAIKALNGESKVLALKNTADRLELAGKAREFRENLLEILTPKGVDQLVKSIP